MKNNILFNLIVVSIIIVLYGCDRETRNGFGIEYNQERIKIGIPIVEKHWDFCYATETVILWDSNSDQLDSIAKHLSKNIKIKNGKRIFEEDNFYKKLNDSTIQQIEIKYTFGQNSNPFEYTNIFRQRKKVIYYGIEDEIAEEVKMSITREQAYNKLKEWNFDLDEAE